MTTASGSSIPSSAAGTADDAGLLNEAARHSVPEQVAAAFASPYDPYRPDPAPGQVWRLEWDSTVVLGVLTRVTDRLVEVAPLGDDPEFGDPATIVLVDASPVGYPIGVWVGLERAVPRVVLDLPIASLNTTDFELLMEMRRRLRRGIALQAHVHVGDPLIDPSDTSDPRIAYRLALEAPLARLAEVFAFVDAAPDVRDELEGQVAPTLSLIAGGEVSPTRGVIAAPLTETLGEALERAAVQSPAVQEALKLTRSDYIALVRGELPLTALELGALAELLQRPATDLSSLVPRVDDDLLVCLHEPEGRRDVHAKATAEGTTDAVARRAVVREVAGARRRERGMGRTDWRQILDDYFGRR